MTKFEQVEKRIKDIVINNFFGGIAWALGATVGFSIVIVILSFFLKNVNLIPFVGDFISKVTEQVLKNLQSNPQLVK